MGRYLFTSESVTEGHPDKICDQISDAVLDEAIRQDKDSRVAIETGAKNGGVMVFGEITTKAWIDVPRIAREVLKDIGYTKSDYGIEYETCSVWTQITEQSPDISVGVSQTMEKEQGAGDQGIMYGYACNESEEYMPLPIILAHKLARKLSGVRKSNEIGYLRPDGKTQVTVEYVDDKPVRVDAVVVSTQHDEAVQYEKIKEDIIDKVIKPVCGRWLDENTKFYVNPTGVFIRGGPYADAGLTGRKIIVDTYGGYCKHGGGAFSGKDPTKVDRSAAYAARYIAKNIVAAGVADKCEVSLAYAIGVAEPVSISANCFNTNKIPEEEILKLIKENFPLKPSDIVNKLDLKRPVYRKTACYGHFGRDEQEFNWEKLDKVDILKKRVEGINV